MAVNIQLSLGWKKQANSTTACNIQYFFSATKQNVLTSLLLGLVASNFFNKFIVNSEGILAGTNCCRYKESALEISFSKGAHKSATLSAQRFQLSHGV